jgi:(E)-4-hydroxy-3-methyl-but-2-enyl pyrophosphate reductase
MKVHVAKTAGFCKGVKDALEVTLEAIQNREDGESICTYGPLIHNRQVLAMLEEKGIKEENDIESCAGKKVVIRAHGIPPNERQDLHKLGASLLDATCKRVAKVHAAIKRHARRGFYTVIAGDADHAEVIGLMGYTDGRGVVINRPEQVDELPPDWENVLLVAQTTQNEELFQKICERFSTRFPNGKVKNTICDSTHERQTEVRQICSQVDAMVIVGGSHSGNTIRLAEVARECGVPTYHIETEAELNRQELSKYSSVGVSAGASTPNWIIRNVVQYLQSIQPEHSEISFKIKDILELLAYGNIYVALGAAFLPFVVQALTDLPVSIAYAGMAACYAYAMHSLNIFLDRSAIQLNDPRRAAFYQHWRMVFTGTGIAAVCIAIWIAAGIGSLTFFAMLMMILLGLLYAVPLILPLWWEKLSAPKLKDIPTSKTFSIPIAWAVVTVLVPHLSNFFEAPGRILYAFLVVFLLVLTRTALLDLLAVQGDRLVGKETLVVQIGEERTVHFTAKVLAVLGFLLLLGPLVGLSTTFALLIIPMAAVYGWHLWMCSKNRLRTDFLSETVMESVVMGAGILAILWNLIAAA